MYYILGLGNPGEKYEHTRHNVGRDIVRGLTDNWQLDKHAQAQRANVSCGGEVVDLLLPETFMNKSGDTVRFLQQKQSATPQEIVVIYDDVDLAFGDIKVSVGRGDGGHNGIKSIISALGNKDFVRIRVGVSPKSFWTGKVKRPTGEVMGKYVLARFSSSEKKKLTELSQQVEKILTTLITDGVEKTMNKYN